MATPWKHPTTGVFYLRRQIPERLRPAFDGKAVWKASLGTKNASEATILFLQANAALEQRFEEVRTRLKATGSPCPTARDRADDMVAAYFRGPELKPGGLEGDERLLLARLEIDRGLWNSTPTGCSHPAPLDDDRWWQMSMNAALFRDHPGRDPVLGHPPGSIWRWDDDRFRAGSKDSQLTRVGAIQALLSFAKAQKWISRNEGRDIPILGYSKARERRTFQEDDLQRLFSSTLFLKPSSWKRRRAVSDSTLYWLFLLGLTTGARLEEIGQAMVSDVKVDGPVTYIDIDDYADAMPSAEEAKSVKTATSRRLVPVHARLLELGFGEYVSSLREAQLTRLFPDLASNQFGKRTKEASRVANRIIDRCVSEDARLVFHSFRHGFKDLALEAGILERIVDQICGHAATTVGGKYGQGVRLSILNRELHRVDWSFLNWTALAAAIRPVSWSAVVADLAGRSSH